MVGKIGRGPLHALKDRQYRHREFVLTETLRTSLLCMFYLTMVAPPRRCLLKPRHGTPVILYTDAASEKPYGDLSSGYVLQSSRLTNTIAGYTTIPRQSLTDDEDKFQLIGQGEMYMPLTAIYNHPSVFQNADVLVFIDNMSALIGCIKGSSRVADSTAIAGAVPSASNPSDGLSREGPGDPLTHRMGWELFEATLPPWRPNVQGFATIVQEIFARKTNTE